MTLPAIDPEFRVWLPQGRANRTVSELRRPCQLPGWKSPVHSQAPGLHPPGSPLWRLHFVHTNLPSSIHSTHVLNAQCARPYSGWRPLPWAPFSSWGMGKCFPCASRGTVSLYLCQLLQQGCSRARPLSAFLPGSPIPASWVNEWI